MIRVTHIITGLAAHGAESMLYRLVSAMDRRRFHNEVLSLTGLGEIGPRLDDEGIPVIALGLKPGSLNPFGLVRLAYVLKASRPDVVQTWMYHADLAGSLAAVLAGRPPVAWGIHHSNLSPDGNKRLTILIAKACARLSRFLPSRIVCCSDASAALHAGLGYAAQKLEVVANGFDLQLFRPDIGARRELRQRLAIPAESMVFGMAARFHPQKDHANFVAAAGRLHSLFPSAHFILCGDGIAWDNRELAEWIGSAGIGERCHLLGRRNDVARLYPAFDVLVSSSLAEAFPLSVGEAMACGVPCVVTDVGDSAKLAGDTGIVVPARNSVALAQACREFVLMGGENRRLMGTAARARIESQFSLDVAVERYERIYDRLARGLAFEPQPAPAVAAETRYRAAGGQDAA